MLNTADVPWTLTQIAGVAVFGLAASLVWAIAGTVDRWASVPAATEPAELTLAGR